jgi:ribosomal protein S12 methylthiotransferase
LVSLGCPKNLVDSEIILADLVKRGFEIRASVEDADIAVINTCSFLESARAEAEEWIRAAARLKRSGRLTAVVVAGCLPAIVGKELLDRFPEVDAVAGPRDRLRVAEACAHSVKSAASRRAFLSGSDALVRAVHPRAVSTGRHTAYLKISEGCDNRCAYCLIPRIRGGLVSRAMGSVVREAELLAEHGVRELCLVAQDTTAYGIDLYGRPALPELLERLEAVRGAAWVRLLYAHPAHWTGRLTEVLRDGPNLCKYADIPIQHVSDRMLRLMRRRVRKRKLVETLRKIRDDVPGVSLRTTVMVGFPGEGEAEFSELMEFLEEFRFDHLGAFSYSREPGTPAASLPGQVSRRVKEDRLRRVMELQRGISRTKNASRRGERVTVLMDTVDAAGARGTGRTEGQAPDVDSVVRVTGKGLSEGRFCEATVVGSAEYELFAEVVSVARWPRPSTRRDR